MNRVIKFRAWDGKSMIEPSSIINGKAAVIKSCDINDRVMTDEDGVHYYCNWDIDKTTDFPLMQFTGLTDKNGVDIYDGDLLRIPAKNSYEDNTYNCFEVFYHDNECIGGYNVGFCMNRMHIQGNSAGGQGYKFTPESIAKNGFVVIGNIFQNKELLK